MTEQNRRNEELIFIKRLTKHMDELKWLYMELYNNQGMFNELVKNLGEFYRRRSESLKKMDWERENGPDWYKKSNMLGMMLYVDNFAGDLKGVRNKLDYLEQANVNYIHLMPLLKTPKGRSDGGYAVADFRTVQKELGTMEDLAELASECHKRNISVCLDFVMNHTSEEHEWAVRARQGEEEYQKRYFFYQEYTVPAMYEKTVPQVFPTTAPGNFTWLADAGRYVMTTFYPYQWDLNYQNPVVFNEMMYNFLYLANQGIDIIRIDAVPYIWKQLGTNCRNLPQVHTIVRMMRMIGEIVCPGILLLGEVVMEPNKVVPYFGTLGKPECHMLYNVTTMATTWHTVATKDVRLLKKQMDIVNSLPKEYVFLNYLRCHDDIGWGLDYDTLWREYGQAEVPHKKFLNDYFRGQFPGSMSRGELYNEDLVTGDARFCATTASMCGIEAAVSEQNEEQIKKAVDLDVMLHAYMLMQSGIPMLYSGDEAAQLNDNEYRRNPDKAPDSRYIHRGKFQWELTEQIGNPKSVPGMVFSRLGQLETIRKKENVFDSDAAVRTIETWDTSILCLSREKGKERVIGLFNFGNERRIAWINEDGIWENMLTGERMKASGVWLSGYGFCWLRAI